MNDIKKVREGVDIALDLLPLLILLAETVTRIIKITKENKDSVTPGDLERIKGLVDLNQSIFD